MKKVLLSYSSTDFENISEPYNYCMYQAKEQKHTTWNPKLIENNEIFGQFAAECYKRYSKLGNESLNIEDMDYGIFVCYIDEGIAAILNLDPHPQDSEQPFAKYA